MTYNFTKYDGSALTTIEPLESNGIDSQGGTTAQSVPRMVLDVDYSSGAFVVADDVTVRFVAGFTFNVLEGAYAGSYTVDVAGSTYDGTTMHTTIPVTAPFATPSFNIINVDTANGIWTLEGLNNGPSVYYPGSSFIVSGTGAGDGAYTTASAETSGSYTISAVVTGPGGTWKLGGGDHTSFFVPGTTFVVHGSTPGAGTYTVATATFNSPTTDIVVVENIPLSATNNGMVTLSPGITLVTVSGAIAGGAGTTGVATSPAIVSYSFSSAPTMLTSLGNNQYSIIWHLTGNHASKFVAGSQVVIRNNNLHDGTIMTIVSAADNGANTDIEVTFRSASTPVAPDGTGELVFPMPPNPYGFIQYALMPTASSLLLVGRGVTAFNNDITWGQALQQNDIYLTENFRTDNGVPPPAPLTGQQWYDEATPALRLFASVKYDVVGVTPGLAGTWTISGNHDAVAELQPGKQFVVYNDTGSGPDSELYTVATITNNGANTDIVVGAAETIPTGAIGNGTLYSMDDWHGVVVSGLPAIGDVDMGGFDIDNVGTIELSDGAVTTPSLTFTSDPNTGLYKSGADVLDVTTNGVNRLSIGTTAITSTLPVVVPLGAQATPSLTFTSDPNTGIYSSAADTVDVATNGVNRLSVGTAGITSTLPLSMSSNKITNLLGPDDVLDAANKAYVDSLTSGIVWLEAVQDPNLFDDTLGGPDALSSADITDPFAPYHRSFIVKPTAYTINGVNSGTSTWTISGNHDTIILAAETFVVDGNTDPAADGTYTVVSATNNGANTDIVVVEAISGTAAADGTLYHARGAWNGLDGQVVVYKPTTASWVSVLTNTSTDLPRTVEAGDRFGVFMLPDNDDPLTTLPGGGLAGQAGMIFIVDSVSAPDYTITWSASPYTPMEPDAVSVLGTNSVHFGKSYTFRGTWGVGVLGTDYKWIQFAGPSMIVDGVGLVYTGNILNLDTTYTDTLYVSVSAVANTQVAVGDGTSLAGSADLTFDTTDGTFYVNSSTTYPAPGFMALEAPSVATGEASPGFGGDAWLFGGWAAADQGGLGGYAAIEGGASKFVGATTAETAWGGSVYVNGGEADATGSAGGSVEMEAGNAPAVTGQPLTAGTISIKGGEIINPGDASSVLGTGDITIEAGVSSGTGAVPATHNGSIDLTTSSTSRLKITAVGEWLVGASAGTAGHVLTSNGAGSAPTWQAAGGGGGSGSSILITMTNANAGTINKGDVVYVSAADSVDLGDADAVGTAAGVIGVVADATIATTASGNICTHGLVTGLVGLTAGATYYLSQTPGQPTSTAPSTAGTWVVPIGIALSTTDLLVNVGTPIQN